VKAAPHDVRAYAFVRREGKIPLTDGASQEGKKSVAHGNDGIRSLDLERVPETSFLVGPMMSILMAPLGIRNPVRTGLLDLRRESSQAGTKKLAIPRRPARESRWETLHPMIYQAWRVRPRDRRVTKNVGTYRKIWTLTYQHRNSQESPGA